MSKVIIEKTADTEDHRIIFVCELAFFFWTLSQLIYGSTQALLVKADVWVSRAGGEGVPATLRSVLSSARVMDIWVDTALLSLQNPTNEEILVPP